MDHLNDSQYKAVMHTDGHLLITAGPGTGKTHTITRRIAHLIPTLKSHEGILAITFTNKAARQMRDRLTSLGVPLSKVFAGTFHSFCLKLLRDHIELTALPKNFKVVMPDDIQGFEGKVLEKISYMKNTRLVIEPDDDYRDYQRYLRQNEWIDFDGILREALALLQDASLAATVAAHYRYVFVDEYQDINIVQNALLKALTGVGSLLTAIGDPHQSIYGFRGSEMALFHRFKEDFPHSLELSLDANYRSASNLLAASSQVIGGLALLAKLDTKGQLLIHSASNDRAEADYVARKIEKMVGGMDMLHAQKAHYTFGDVAILFRLNAQRHAITKALEELSIPYQVAQKPRKPQEYSDEAVLGQFEEELDYNVEKVSLLSLHAAKGLEFPVVFIVGCEEGVLPLHCEGMKADKEEERRLLFVGMTRAKEYLSLSYARQRQLFGKSMQLEPSGFLRDIDEQLKSFEAAKKRVIKKDPDAAQMKLF